MYFGVPSSKPAAERTINKAERLAQLRRLYGLDTGGGNATT